MIQLRFGFLVSKIKNPAVRQGFSMKIVEN